MIAMLAAGLGANNTSAWLVSAAGAVVIKVFVADPIKVCVLTACVQFAEDHTRDAMVQARNAITDAEASIAARVSVARNNVSNTLDNVSSTIDIVSSRHRREP